jgi:hypothetical protein
VTIAFSAVKLNINDPDAIARYERALFRAFAPVWTNTSDRIFILDKKEKRVRSRIDYAGQEILTINSSGAIVAGFAINYDCGGTLQLELLGFHIDRTERFCEALILFNTGGLEVGSQLLTISKKHLKEQASARSCEVIYGTSNAKNARGYRNIGFSVVDTFTFDGQEKFLLAARPENFDTIG